MLGHDWYIILHNKEQIMNDRVVAQMPLTNWTCTIVCAIMQKAPGTQIREYETEVKGRGTSSNLCCFWCARSHKCPISSAATALIGPRALFFHFLLLGRHWLRSMRAYVCKYWPLCDASFTLKRLQICGKNMSSLWVYERLSGNSALVCKHHLFIYLFILKSALVPQGLPVWWREPQPNPALRPPPVAQRDEGLRNNSSLCSVWPGASTWQHRRGCRAHGGQPAAAEVHWRCLPLTRLPSNSHRDELPQSLRWDTNPVCCPRGVDWSKKSPCCDHIMNIGWLVQDFAPPPRELLERSESGKSRLCCCGL